MNDAGWQAETVLARRLHRSDGRVLDCSVVSPMGSDCWSLVSFEWTGNFRWLRVAEDTVLSKSGSERGLDDQVNQRRTVGQFKRLPDAIAAAEEHGRLWASGLRPKDPPDGSVAAATERYLDAAAPKKKPRKKRAKTSKKRSKGNSASTARRRSAS